MKKGLKVRAWHRHISKKWLVAVFFAVLLLVFTLTQCLEFAKGIAILLASVTALVVTIVIHLKMKSFYNYLLDIESLERMVRYQNLAKIEKIDRRKVYVYYPSIYLKKKAREYTVTVELDASDFHRNVAYHLAPMFEDLFIAELESQRKVGRTLVYRLIAMSYETCKFDIDLPLSRYSIPITKDCEWNFLDYPHGMVNGSTGGGKTMFLIYLITEFMKLDCTLKILDFKRSKLYSLRHILGEDSVFCEQEEILNQIDKANKEIEQRYKLMDLDSDSKETKNFLEYGLKPYVVIFDEIIIFSDKLSSKQKKDEFKLKIGEICLLGRECGVFIIVASQRADAEYFGKARDNFFLRVALGSLSKDGIRMTFGESEKKFLHKGSGEGYVIVQGAMGSVKEFAAPWVPDDYKEKMALLKQRKV